MWLCFNTIVKGRGGDIQLVNKVGSQSPSTKKYGNGLKA